MHHNFTRPKGIMLQILLIILFRSSPKNSSLCSLLFFLCSWLLLLFHKIVPIANVMHKLQCSITSYNIRTMYYNLCCIKCFSVQWTLYCNINDNSSMMGTSRKIQNGNTSFINRWMNKIFLIILILCLIIPHYSRIILE